MKNTKTISISIFSLVLPLFVIVFMQVAANAQSYTPEEQNCFNMVQGKVAYNKEGSNTWGTDNIRTLCKGTTDAVQTISCFSTKIAQGVVWNVASPACASKSALPNLSGTWVMYNDKNVKYDKTATISQNGNNLSINNGYGTNSTAILNGDTFTFDGLKGTVSADRTKINFSNSFVWQKVGSTTSNPASHDFYMIIASDPQYPRMYSEGTTEEDYNQPTKSRAVNERQVINIKALIDQLGSDKVKGIIINGDLTEYGHSGELSTYKEIWSKEKLGSKPIYPGLGNHDYVNNLGGCTPDCTNRMLGYMKGLLTSNEVVTSSYDSDSLAYSWDIGNVHFIQLHLHPATAVNTGTYNIKPSVNWFEEDLKKARTAGKVIIVNLHDYDDTFKGNSPNQFNEFKNLLQKYKVSAVFAGHIHRSLGEIDTVGNTKIFRSGSPIHNSYLLVHFKDNKIKVENVSSAANAPSRSNTVEFDVNTSNQADNTISIPARLGTATYKVKIVTGNSTGAGTNSNVYISFTGTNAQSGEYLLDDSKDNFEKGDIDEFTLNNVEDVGEIKGFNIRSDLSNPGSEWELQSVQITKGNLFYQKTVNKLLGENEKSQYYAVNGTTQRQYTVKLKTADVADAGTDSNISFKICNGTNCTDAILLNPQLSGNAFERGATDTVTFTDIDVGAITKIEIQSDHLYAGADWNLESVTIETGNKSYNFPVNYNFADTTARSFAPGELPADYTLAIKTTDASGAGTDSNIYLKISGIKGSTQEQHLNSKISGNAFERNNTDTLTFSDKDVGAITSITIRSDTKYAGSDWELEWLIVTLKGKHYIFRPRKVFADTNELTFLLDEIK